MLSFLIKTSFSWNDMYLTIIGEYAERVSGSDIRTMWRNALDLDENTYERPSLACTWISFTERAPYNNKCFNHWRYNTNPYYLEGNESDYTIDYQDQDDLTSVITNGESALKNPSSCDAWSYNFLTKTTPGLIGELFNPLHNINMYSSKFPKGDRNGRDFYILYQNTKMSLADFWDSGCGRLSNDIHYPFTAEQWDQIDNEVLRLHQIYKNTKNSTAWATIENNFVQHAENYYKDIVENQELPDSYVEFCKASVDQLIACAANRVYYLFSYISMPSYSPKLNKPIETREAVAWGLLLFLLPFFAFLLWNTLNNKLKKE